MESPTTVSVTEAIEDSCGKSSILTAALVERFSDCRNISELREALRSLEQDIHHGYEAAMLVLAGKDD